MDLSTVADTLKAAAIPAICVYGSAGYLYEAGQRVTASAMIFAVTFLWGWYALDLSATAACGPACAAPMAKQYVVTLFASWLVLALGWGRYLLLQAQAAR